MPVAKSWWPSEARAPIWPALPCSLWLCPGVSVCGVACPPFSRAQGSSSKAWHHLSFLQNIHNNNINNNRRCCGAGAQPRSPCGVSSCLRGAGAGVSPGLGTVLQVQWLWRWGTGPGRVQHQVPKTARDAGGEPAPSQHGHVGGSACGEGTGQGPSAPGAREGRKACAAALQEPRSLPCPEGACTEA